MGLTLEFHAQAEAYSTLRYLSGQVLNAHTLLYLLTHTLSSYDCKTFRKHWSTTPTTSHRHQSSLPRRLHSFISPPSLVTACLSGTTQPTTSIRQICTGHWQSIGPKPFRMQAASWKMARFMGKKPFRNGLSSKLDRNHRQFLLFYLVHNYASLIAFTSLSLIY